MCVQFEFASVHARHCSNLLPGHDALGNVSAACMVHSLSLRQSGVSGLAYYRRQIRISLA